MSGFSYEEESLSKSLSLILRVTAREEGLQIDEQGFVDVDAILNIPRLKKHDEAKVLDIVKRNDKQRYSVRKHPDTGKLQIRANQGHTIPSVNPDLKVITDPTQYPSVVHGTNREAYELIRFEGLHRMGRNHIHFASGVPGGDEEVISGMRDDADIHIYVDLKRALADGIQFLESLNKVILCPGDENGFLPSRYFSRVRDVRSGVDLDDFCKETFEREQHTVKNPEKLPKLIHPTSHRLYSKIRRHGLAKTKGNYVNLVLQEPDKEQHHHQVLIYLNVAMVTAVAANLTLYQFVDGEVLCQEDLGLGYFEKVVEVKTGRELLF